MHPSGFHKVKYADIYSWLSRCITKGGSDPWYNWGGPAKVGIGKYFIDYFFNYILGFKNQFLHYIF